MSFTFLGKDSLVTTASTKFARIKGPKIDKLNTFLNWYDKSFRCPSLRQQLFVKLCNWVIDKDSNPEEIVSDYKHKLALFNQTLTMSTLTVIESTQLSRSMQISSINRA